MHRKSGREDFAYVKQRCALLLRGWKRKRLFLGAVAALWAACAFGYGPWLEEIPIGGVEMDDAGLSRAELERRLEAIELETKGQPVIVARTKSLAMLFDNVRLAVNTNDLFVHWHPDCSLLPLQTMRRVGKFAAASGGAFKSSMGGAFNCRLDTSHTCPDWESVVNLGFTGLAERARRRRATAHTDEERLFLDCVVEVYEALSRECLRWAALAERKGMKEVAAVLRENAAHEPRTFREALQLSLVYDRAQEAEGEDVRSQGLFDRLFLKFYEGDIAAGRETRESAKRLIADYYTRLYAQQHPNNKNIAFGGYGADGKPVWNDLTELGFEVFRELGRINPKLTYRFGERTPRWQLEKVTQCIAEGKNSIVFACEETLAKAFRRRGKAEEDICSYVLVGCYEPGIGGREVVASMSADINLAKPLEAAFNSGKTFDGARIGPDCELPVDGSAFEREYLRQLDAMVVTALESSRTVERHWHDLNPAPLHSGAFRDCVANARDYSQGGCRYNSSGVDCSGIGTVADSLAAVRYLVDEAKAVTMEDLRDALRTDWKGREDLRLRARGQAPKWGNNNDAADAAAKRVYDALVKRINSERNGHGGYFQAGLWSIFLDMSFGKRTAATPDGRRSGDALSRNNVATAGCGKEGPLALMLSNLKLDQTESPDGHIMDVILPMSVTRKPTAAKDIASVLATYFKRGGQCIHMNCFDSALLRDATAHPEKYPDLQVRVCGWNVRWNDLSPAEKRHFIATTAAQE